MITEHNTKVKSLIFNGIVAYCERVYSLWLEMVRNAEPDLIQSGVTALQV